MIRLDYNAETEDGHFYARRARLDGVLSVGATVETRDADGNRLDAVVAAVDDALVYFRPLWDSWRGFDDDTANLALFNFSALPKAKVFISGSFVHEALSYAVYPKDVPSPAMVAVSREGHTSDVSEREPA